MRMQLSLSEEVRMRLLEEYFAGRLPSQPSQSSQPSQPSHTWKCHQHSASDVAISKVLSLISQVPQLATVTSGLGNLTSH